MTTTEIEISFLKFSPGSRVSLFWSDIFIGHTGAPEIKQFWYKKNIKKWKNKKKTSSL